MFDSHAHVTASQYDQDRDEVMSRARAAGVTNWLEVGTDLETSKRAVALAEHQEGVFATVGVHPNNISSITEATWGEIRQLLQHPKVKAVGEIGLDFYRGGDPETQKDVVEYFIRLAQENNLPVVFHVRSGPEINAHDELLYILSTFSAADRPAGVIHTYSGTAEQARRYLEYGMYLSFSGVITFDNAQTVIAAAAWAPLDRILIETDCPYLAPAPYRGQRNEPAYVKLVAEKLAQIKNMPTEKVIEQTQKNTQAFLGLTT